MSKQLSELFPSGSIYTKTEIDIWKHNQNTDTTVGGVDVAEDTDSFILTGSTGVALTVDETTLISNKANKGANSDITSMTGLSDDGIPLAKVANALSDTHASTHPAPTTRDARNQVAGSYAASGANSDITSITGLDDGGIPLAKVAGTSTLGKSIIEIQVFS